MTFSEAKAKSREAKQLFEAGDYKAAADLYGEIVTSLAPCDDPGGWLSLWTTLRLNAEILSNREAKK